MGEQGTLEATAVLRNATIFLMLAVAAGLFGAMQALGVAFWAAWLLFVLFSELSLLCLAAASRSRHSHSESQQPARPLFTLNPHQTTAF
jgi:membrane protein implicated in regulation of membrane protease activity